MRSSTARLICLEAEVITSVLALLLVQYDHLGVFLDVIDCLNLMDIETLPGIEFIHVHILYSHQCPFSPLIIGQDIHHDILMSSLGVSMQATLQRKSVTQSIAAT